MNLPLTLTEIAARPVMGLGLRTVIGLPCGTPADQIPALAP